jgi:anti-sigma-K factor RskA
MDMEIEDHALGGPDYRCEVAKLYSRSDEAVNLAATDLSPYSTASLFVDPKDNKALMMAAGLKPPSPDRVYQLWMRRTDGSIVSLGTFRTYREGYVMWPFQSPYALAAYRSISVTMEPMGGSPWPTSPTVLGSLYSVESTE